MAIFEGVPQHLMARYECLPTENEILDLITCHTKDFIPEFAILKRLCRELDSNAWQRKPTVTSLELLLRQAASQSALVNSGQCITAILQKHRYHLTADEIYQCCLLVFGESHPQSRQMHANRGTFHFTYATKILLWSQLTPDDIHAALSQLLKSADLIDPRGILTLAELYEHGLGDTIAKDPMEALRWRMQYAKLDPKTFGMSESAVRLIPLMALYTAQEACKRLLCMQQSVD